MTEWDWDFYHPDSIAGAFSLYALYFSSLPHTPFSLLLVWNGHTFSLFQTYFLLTYGHGGDIWATYNQACKLCGLVLCSLLPNKQIQAKA